MTVTPMKTQTVLCVDDDITVLNALRSVRSSRRRTPRRDPCPRGASRTRSLPGRSRTPMPMRFWA
ncbi:hypothetical protein CCP4SC76_7700003 [Gammaproteobacteria bacterium]